MTMVCSFSSLGWESHHANEIVTNGVLGTNSVEIYIVDHGRSTALQMILKNNKKHHLKDRVIVYPLE